jgi:transmembrane sensor
LGERPVQVLVRQGIVEVEGSSAGRSTVIRLAANSRAVLKEAQPIAVTPVASMEVSRELSWREGMLSFEDLPLRDAADEFARYSDTRITFDDPAIGKETVTGLFAANNPGGFAKSVALSLGLRTQNGPEGVTLSKPN